MNRGTVALLAGIALVVGACGSDDGGGGGATNPVGTTAPTTPETAGETTPPTDGSDTTTPATDSTGVEIVPGDTIKIGFTSIDSATLSLPGYIAGFDGAIRYLEANGGTIGGREFTVERCTHDETPEGAVQCANTLVSGGVDLVISGYELQGDSTVPIYQAAGVPVIGYVSSSPLEVSATGTFYSLEPATDEILGTSLVAAKAVGASSVAIILRDHPVLRSIHDRIVPRTKEALGITTDVFYYTPTEDWTAFIAAVLQKNPDHIDMVAADELSCAAALPAIDAAGFTGTVNAGVCNATLASLPPELTNGMIKPAMFPVPEMRDSLPAEVAADLDIYIEFMEDDPLFLSRGAPEMFSVVATVDGILAQIGGELDSESISAGLPSVTGRVFLMNAPYRCDGTVWKGSTTCVTGMSYAVMKDGRQQSAEFNPVLMPESVRGSQ